MEKIHISKGFKLKLTGIPDNSIIRLPRPATVAVSAQDIPHIRPKLLVRQGDAVKTGTPLFTDKRDRSVLYVSPGTGRVQEIRFGERRRLLEVVIALERLDDFTEFEPVSESAMAGLSADALADRLKQGGVWQNLRQLPARDTADAATRPPLIIVSLDGNDWFSPLPDILLTGNHARFLSGLDLLKRFSDRIVVTARESSLERLGSLRDQVTHTVPDVYPAWDPAVVLYHLKTTPEENAAWFVSLQGLMDMAGFLAMGRFPVETMVTVTKAGAAKPHIITRKGAPISLLAGQVPEGGTITTGQFNGREADPNTHLGYFETTLNILADAPGDEMFGFIRPGSDKPTVSKTFLSCLFDREQTVDATLHGEERACINCSYCEKICPVDLMPSFIMKALNADDIEEALQMGLMDCVRCGLCSFTCPSKIELTRILTKGMDAHHKDKA